MKLHEWIAVEKRIDSYQIPDGPALVDQLPRDFVESLTPEEALALRYDWRATLRPRQQPPPGDDWLVWALITGRGFGKSHAAAAWIADRLEHDPGDYLLVAPTESEVLDLCWEPIKEALAPGVRYTQQLKQQRITFPDWGSRLLIWSAEKSQARGKNLRGAWCEEIVAWPGGARGGMKLWRTLSRALRVKGKAPARCLLTTTPPDTLDHWLLDVLADPATYVTRGESLDNPLLDSRNVEAWYREASNDAERENRGRFVFGADGALFTVDLIERGRVLVPPPQQLVVVSLDPTQSDKRDADSVGLSAMGLSASQGYLLESHSDRMSPDVWADLAIEMALRHHASVYIVEPTGSGDLPDTVLRQQFKLTKKGILPIVPSKAKGPKHVRAKPLAQLARQGRFHVVGYQEEFEREATQWYPGAGFSPGALDSAAHAWRYLEKFAR